MHMDPGWGGQECVNSLLWLQKPPLGLLGRGSSAGQDAGRGGESH